MSPFYLNFKKVISIGIIYVFIGNALGPLPAARADSALAGGEFLLSAPGSMVSLSSEFNPPILKGLKVHPDNPFRFDFILDQGDGSVIASEAKVLMPDTRSSSQSYKEQLKTASTRLIKYFLASLTIPEKDLWVNLSPYEKTRIIPNSFGLTEMGRDLLAEDYMLKQITASLIYPEGEVGKKFWKSIYREAVKEFHTTNIPVNTFNKVWILPEKAVVYENAKAGTAYVVEAKLKVMLEEDYLALEKHVSLRGAEGDEGPHAGHSQLLAILNRTTNQKIASFPMVARSSYRTLAIARNDTSKLGSQILREIVIPQLTKEVNEGKNFAQLRQVYNSLILATWYKKKIKDSILAQVYVDRNKVVGVGYDDSIIARSEATKVLMPDTRSYSQSFKRSPCPFGARDDTDVELIYQHYLQAFKKGVFNYIKEETDPLTQENIPRKYFSGGTDLAMASIFKIVDLQNIQELSGRNSLLAVSTALSPINAPRPQRVDRAMNIAPDSEKKRFLEEYIERKTGKKAVVVSITKGDIDNLLSKQGVPFEKLINALKSGQPVLLDLRAFAEYQERENARRHLDLEAILLLAGKIGDTIQHILKKDRLGYAFRELLKNAVVHGNGDQDRLDYDQPVYFFTEVDAHGAVHKLHMIDMALKRDKSESFKERLKDDYYLAGEGLFIKIAKKRSLHYVREDIVDKQAQWVAGSDAMIRFDVSEELTWQEAAALTPQFRSLKDFFDQMVLWRKDHPKAKLVFINRHGESTSNIFHLSQSNDGFSPLTTLGERQRTALAAYLEHRIQFDRIISSGSERAFGTIEPLAKMQGVAIEIQEALREVLLFPIGSVPMVQMQKLFPNNWKEFLNDPLSFGLTRSDSIAVKQRALMGLLDEIAHQDKLNVAISTHGMTIDLILMEMLGINYGKIRNVFNRLEDVPNASITLVAFDPDDSKWHLLVKPDNSYLDPSLRIRTSSPEVLDQERQRYFAIAQEREAERLRGQTTNLVDYYPNMEILAGVSDERLAAMIDDFRSSDRAMVTGLDKTASIEEALKGILRALPPDRRITTKELIEQLEEIMLIPVSMQELVEKVISSFQNIYPNIINKNISIKTPHQIPYKQQCIAALVDIQASLPDGQALTVRQLTYRLRKDRRFADVPEYAVKRYVYSEPALEKARQWDQKFAEAFVRTWHAALETILREWPYGEEVTIRKLTRELHGITDKTEEVTGGMVREAILNDPRFKNFKSRVLIGSQAVAFIAGMQEPGRTEREDVQQTGEKVLGENAKPRESNGAEELVDTRHPKTYDQEPERDPDGFQPETTTQRSASTTLRGSDTVESQGEPNSGVGFGRVSRLDNLRYEDIKSRYTHFELDFLMTQGWCGFNIGGKEIVFTYLKGKARGKRAFVITAVHKAKVIGYIDVTYNHKFALINGAFGGNDFIYDYEDNKARTRKITENSGLQIQELLKPLNARFGAMLDPDYRDGANQVFYHIGCILMSAALEAIWQISNKTINVLRIRHTDEMAAFSLNDFRVYPDGERPEDLLNIKVENWSKDLAWVRNNKAGQPVVLTFLDSAMLTQDMAMTTRLNVVPASLEAIRKDVDREQHLPNLKPELSQEDERFVEGWHATLVEILRKLPKEKVLKINKLTNRLHKRRPETKRVTRQMVERAVLDDPQFKDFMDRIIMDAPGAASTFILFEDINDGSLNHLVSELQAKGHTVITTMGWEGLQKHLKSERVSVVVARDDTLNWEKLDGVKVLNIYKYQRVNGKLLEKKLMADIIAKAGPVMPKEQGDEKREDAAQASSMTSKYNFLSVQKGGIDFTPTHLKVRAKGQEAIKFHIDSAQLVALRQAEGFVPVIIHMEPIKDLQAFLTQSI